MQQYREVWLLAHVDCDFIVKTLKDTAKRMQHSQRLQRLEA